MRLLDQRDSSFVIPARAELHDRLAPLTHGMFRQLTGKHEAHGGLHLPRGHGVFPGQRHESRGLLRNAIEGVVHAGFHDHHGLL